MNSSSHLVSDDVAGEARQLEAIRKALIVTRATVDPSSGSAAELDELIKLAKAALDDLRDDARTAAILDAALGRPFRGVAHG